MKTAAVSKLKASLSEFLLRVKAGEEVIITDRGKPVAKIVPISRVSDDIPANLLTLEKAGLARIGRHSLPHDFWKKKRPKDKTGRALLNLLKEREENR